MIPFSTRSGSLAYRLGAVLAAATIILAPIQAKAGAAASRPQEPRSETPKPGTLTPKMTLNRWSISDLQLSPDRTRIAFVVSQPQAASGQRRNIWLYEAAGGGLTSFTSSTKSDTRPRWSPDGQTLAFLSNREGSNQIYLIPLSGGEAHRLTEGKTGVSSFEWAPDGHRIAFETTSPKTEAEEQKEKDKDDSRLVGVPEARTLFQVIDLESKALTTLVKGAWRISGYAWLPDGGSLVVTATDSPRLDMFSEKIYRVAADDGVMTLLESPSGPFGEVRVSPDGRAAAFAGSRGDGPEQFDLFALPLAGGGKARNLTALSIDRRVGSFAWRDSGALLVAAADGFGNAFYEVSLDGRAVKSEWTPRMTVRSFAAGKSRLAFVGETAVQAPELWMASAPGQAAKVSRFNQDWDSIKLVEPLIYRYSSFDGLPVEAAYFRPEGASASSIPPLIVLVHGGPTGAWTDRFNAWAQLLVQRGFAVLCPNIRGSVGYGFDFMVRNRKDWGGGDFNDVMAGVDDLVKRGLADPGRLGIGGWSYGGYMAAWAVTQTSRFKAAVSGAPMTDLAVEYGTEEPGINPYDTWFMGNPYEDPALFAARSPLTFVKKVRTPTLILCGEEDRTDPIAQCYQFHRGLARFGVPVEFVAYPREGHGIREEKHQIDVLNRLLDWFDVHLGNSNVRRDG